MVGPLGIARNRHGHADDAEEHEHQGPPGEVGEAAADGGYYACDKGNDPGELGVSVKLHSDPGVVVGLQCQWRWWPAQTGRR